MNRAILKAEGDSSFVRFGQRKLAAPCWGLAVLLASVWSGLAQPILLSSVPAYGATGISPSAPVVFTFSEPMDVETVIVDFVSTIPQPPFYTIYNTILSWNATTNILTCTPSPPFLSLAQVIWTLDGADLATGTYMDLTNGMFTTSSGGGGGGSGTNAFTSFVVGKTWSYDQTSTAAPTLDPTTPYIFTGMTALASNRTANTITLTIPTTPTPSVSNLVQIFSRPEFFYLPNAFTTSLATFNSTFPAGNYQFNVSSTQSNQQVNVNLPGYSQPNAPRVSNFTAAQTVNPAQPFTLTWDAFSGGGTTDYVAVVIGSAFQTPGLGQSNALNGTATSVLIPANTLQVNSNYSSSIGFYRATFTTNGTTVTEAFVGSVTDFTITTTTSASAPILTNAVRSAGVFGFDVLTANGQTVTVVYNTNLNTASATWPILLTTNSPGALFHVNDPRSVSNKTLFYRARNGN